MTEPPLHRHLHLKFAALSVVGAALVLVPLSEVLRYQGEAIQAARAEHAALDPMGESVALQRALLTHGELAAQVLRGRVTIEPQRKLRAADVDQRLGALSQTLHTLAWLRPLEESQALAADWQQLARAVQTRSIGAAASDVAHRLRVEQSLQIMDLLVLAWAPAADPGTATLRHAVAGLPRLTWEWAQPPAMSTEAVDTAHPAAAALAPATANAGAAVPAAAGTGTAALRALARQTRLLAELAASPQAQADRSLAGSIQAAQQATAGLHAVLSGPGHSAEGEASPGLDHARTAALQAVAAVHGAAWQHQVSAAQRRLVQHQDARTATLLSLGALLLAGLWLALGLRRPAPLHAPASQPEPEPKPAPAADADPAPGAESRPEAGRLIQRLRDPMAGTGAPIASTGRQHAMGPDIQPTSPPAD